MLLTPLVFIAAITLEVLGSYMSVVGLSSKSSLVLIILAIALDFSKIVIASVIYKNWKHLNFMFKMFLVPTTVFLMVITSYGAYAYLLQEFGKTTANGEQISVKLEALETESKKLAARKKEIDTQIADVSPMFVTQKKRLGDMFAKELEYLNQRTIELDREIPVVRSSQMSDNLSAGTLGSLAKAWGTTPDQTAKIIALMMVIVIDPLAIVMLMVGNFLQIKRQDDLEQAEIRAEEKRIAQEKREYELKKLKMSIEKEEVKVHKEEVAVHKEEIALQKEELELQHESHIPQPTQHEDEPVIIDNIEVEKKTKERVKPIRKEVKPVKETKTKNSWEAATPSVLVAPKDKKEDADLDSIVSLVENKSAQQSISSVEEDPFHASNSIDDMLNGLDDLDGNSVVKKVMVNSDEK